MTPLKLLLAAALGGAALGCAPEAVTAAPPVHPSQPSQPQPSQTAPAPSAQPSDPPAAARRPLTSTALKGPYATAVAACDAAAGLSGRPAGTPCAVTPISLGAGAPFTAALLRAEDRSDPRYAASGVFFLALAVDGAWFVVPRPLDQLNGAAGHIYLPVVTVVDTVTVAHGGGRTLFHLKDATSSVCNACEGAERDKRTPVQTRALVLVCGREASGKPACTAPLELDEKARVSLGADGTLSAAPPHGAATVYQPQL